MKKLFLLIPFILIIGIIIYTRLQPTTTTFKDLGFSVSYPPHWQVSRTANSNTVILTNKNNPLPTPNPAKNPDYASTNTQLITISRIPTSQANNEEMQEKLPVIIGGHPAFRYIQGGYALVLSYSIDKNGSTWVISYDHKSSEDQLTEEEKQIIYSFKLL